MIFRIILLLFLFLLLLLVLYDLYLRTKYRRIKNKEGKILPFVEEPLLGLFKSFYLTQVKSVNPSVLIDEYVRRARDKKQTWFQSVFSGFHTIIVTDSKEIHTIFKDTATFGKGQSQNKYGERFLGDSVLLSEGETWKHQRQIINPAFTPTAIQNFMPIFLSVCQQTIQMLKQLDGQPIDVYQLFKKLTLDGLGIAAFGESLQSIKRKHGDVEAIYKGIMDIFKDFLRMMGIKDLFPLKSNKIVAKYFDDFDDFVFSMIEDRKKNRSDDRKLLLDFLIDASDEGSGKKLTNVEVKNNVNTFFLAGHETTSSALAMIAYELSRNPEIQDKARKLVIEKVGKDAPSYDQTNLVPYINAIINETLRLHPPVPGVTRYTNNDVELNGFFIPKNTFIIVPSYSLHRLEEVWGSDAKIFRPERWIENGFKPPVGYYMPFGKGSRICVGNVFATLEMRIAVLMLLQNFELLPSPLHPELKIGFEMTIRPQDGFTIKFKPLDSVA
eukprot:TRINITY_DN1113_c0_g1_i1.p1 TRINITY_DN1113_c0_g1~~TRINITY_DN1113_c0_g1_i1.p1  ORF type:complete len:497 (-),score=74.65 TRINITY_DN1113_c0_g1_i1:42-1532(-)